ncbi:Cytosolic Fe-S cluster assembly factor nar1, partial [Frankliniella fusca]
FPHIFTHLHTVSRSTSHFHHFQPFPSLSYIVIHFRVFSHIFMHCHIFSLRHFRPFPSHYHAFTVIFAHFHTFSLFSALTAISDPFPVHYRTKSTPFSRLISPAAISRSFLPVVLSMKIHVHFTRVNEHVHTLAGHCHECDEDGVTRAIFGIRRLYS